MACMPVKILGQGRPIKQATSIGATSNGFVAYFKTGSFISQHCILNYLWIFIEHFFHITVLLMHLEIHFCFWVVCQNFFHNIFNLASCFSRLPVIKSRIIKSILAFSAIPLTATGCTKPWRFSVVSGLHSAFGNAASISPTIFNAFYELIFAYPGWAITPCTVILTPSALNVSSSKSAAFATIERIGIVGAEFGKINLCSALANFLIRRK